LFLERGCENVNWLRIGFILRRTLTAEFPEQSADLAAHRTPCCYRMSVP